MCGFTNLTSHGRCTGSRIWERDSTIDVWVARVLGRSAVDRSLAWMLPLSSVHCILSECQEKWVSNLANLIPLNEAKWMCTRHKTNNFASCQSASFFMFLSLALCVSRRQLLQVLVESGYRPNLKATVQLDEVHVHSSCPRHGRRGAHLSVCGVPPRCGPLNDLQAWPKSYSPWKQSNQTTTSSSTNLPTPRLAWKDVYQCVLVTFLLLAAIAGALLFLHLFTSFHH